MPKAFMKSEFDRRLVRVKESMRDFGVDVICVVSPANIDYLTGYNVKSYSNVQAVIVDMDDDQPHWLGRFMDTGGAKLLTFLDDGHLHHYPDDHVDSETKHPFDMVVALLGRQGLSAKRIGIEMSAFYMQPKAVDVMKLGLPNAQIVDATRLVNWVRTIKSPAELAYMKEAAILTDLGMQAGFDSIEVGKRENEVAADIMNAMLKGTPEIGGFATSNIMMPTGEEFAATYHTSWSDLPYKAETSTGFEFTGARHHYSAPLARNVFLGTPPERLMWAASVMIEGLEALIDGVKAGMSGEEAERIWREVAIKQGVDKEARIGYAVGLDYPPTGWSEQTVSLRPGSAQILEENMTIHCIPSLMQGHWGLEISETIVVGRDKSEALSKLPRDVVVKT